MEGAKNAYRGFQEARRADTPNQGLSGRQEPRKPPAKPNRTGQAATRLVGGRRPLVLQQRGSGGLPRRFPVALKALSEPWRVFLTKNDRSEIKARTELIFHIYKRDSYHAHTYIFASSL